MAYNPEWEQLNTCMHTLSEDLSTLQNLKCPSLTQHSLWGPKTYLDVLLLQGSHYSLFSLAECTVLSPCMGVMYSAWGHTVSLHNAICFHQNDRIIFLPKHLPSPSHENREFQFWNRVATCDLHPNHLSRTSVYIELATIQPAPACPFLGAHDGRKSTFSGQWVQCF